MHERINEGMKQRQRGTGRRLKKSREYMREERERTTGQDGGMDGCFLFHLTWALIHTHTDTHTRDTPFKAQLFMNGHMQLFMKLIIEERWIRGEREKVRGRTEKNTGKREQRQRGGGSGDAYHKPNQNGGLVSSPLLSLHHLYFCSHLSHCRLTFLSSHHLFST